MIDTRRFLRGALLAPVLLLGLGGNLPARQSLPIPRLAGPIRIVRATIFGLDLPIGRPTDVVLRSDDSVCITDMGFGSLAIFDMGSSSLSILSPTGKFTARKQIQMMFSQVSGALALPGGRLALSGYAPNARYAGDSAVHVFQVDTSVRHLRSFGPLPTSRNRDALNYWGAGRMTRTPDGMILYAQRIPYELKWYDDAGRLKHSVTVPAKVSPSADLAFATAKDDTSATVSVTSNLVLAPGTALQISPTLVLAQRVGTRRGQVEEVWWDYVARRDGRLIHSERLPKGFGIVELIGLSRDGRTLFALALIDEVPCIVRLDFEVRSLPS